MQPSHLTVAGLGPGDPGLVTVAGAEALRAADVVFVPRSRDERDSIALSICEPYLDRAHQEIVTLPLAMALGGDDAHAAWDAAAAAIVAALRPGRKVVYALLGDPQLYGTWAYLQGRLRARRPDLAITFIPGITSLSAAAAAIGEPLVMGKERLAVLPATYEGDSTSLERILAEFDTLALLKAGRNLPPLLKLLESRRDHARIWLAERLGLSGERVVEGWDAVAAADAGYFSLALVKQERRRPAWPSVQARAGTVYIIGAGPGAPDLVTLRAQAYIAQADAVVYADSLVMDAVTAWAKPDARAIPTSGMHLDDIVALMRDITARGGIVARVHSGDPSLYGATHEQMSALDAAGIPYEIVPGVTVAFAAAARLGAELTVPEVTQTIILTRVSGRASPVPEAENLRGLAAHGASLAIYLAATKARQVQDELLAGGYPPATALAICYRVEWPDEQIVRCRLDQLAEQMRAHGFTRQVLILVSPALDARPATRSRLYDAGYAHRFRNRRTEQTRPLGERGRGRVRSSPEAYPKPTIVAITRAGSTLAATLAEHLQGTAHVPTRFAQLAPGADGARVLPYEDRVLDLVRTLWLGSDALLLIMPTGVAVRAIGALASDKQHDPAVVVCDEAGRSVISLLGGHLGGANVLARVVAEQTGGQAIITTASDVQETVALDLLGRERGWRIAPGSALTRASAALVNGDRLALWDPYNLLQGAEWLATVERITSPAALSEPRFGAIMVVDDRVPEPGWLEHGVVYHPPTICAGIGCRRDTPLAAIDAAVRMACARVGVALEALASVATVDLKAEEPGLLGFVEQQDLPLRMYGAADLQAVEPAAPFSPSAATERFDLPGVAEPCALLAAGTTRLLLPKQVLDGVTVALARKEVVDG